MASASTSSILAVLLSPDIACTIASYQNGSYSDLLPLRSKVCPIYKSFFEPSFIQTHMKITNERLQLWLDTYGTARIPKLLASSKKLQLVLVQYAVYFGRLDLVTWLHAALDLKSLREPLVSLAALNEQTHILEYLREIQHPGDNFQVLQWATESGHLTTVKYLMEYASDDERRRIAAKAERSRAARSRQPVQQNSMSHRAGQPTAVRCRTTQEGSTPLRPLCGSN
ncbi:hypothetical protein Ae201684P_014689 [Aphanomyces euteiches]|nr:hypothetical protein Ae201684P_014689 [Aphanomyces euteiches]KAH9151690.1 hypothetical protein AeRB84_005749 [Aphanomyces euteiches]